MSAASAATTPNTAASVASATLAANRLPASAPASMPGLQARTVAQSIAPRAAWARDEEMAVGMMVASEVATAMCIDQCAVTPELRSTVSRTGTNTMPPPTPSRPASTPAKSAVATNIAARGQRVAASMGPQV